MRGVHTESTEIPLIPGGFVSGRALTGVFVAVASTALITSLWGALINFAQCIAAACGEQRAAVCGEQRAAAACGEQRAAVCGSGGLNMGNFVQPTLPVYFGRYTRSSWSKLLRYPNIGLFGV